MRGGVHDTFDPITIHTAKCDLCNKHNTSTMFRCTKCGRQCCTPCWDRKGGDGRHSLHNNKKLEYKGPKAEPLPPPETPKPAAAQPTRRSTRAVLERKRGRAKTVIDTAEEASYASPAASAAGSVSTGEAEVQAPKRRRHQTVDSLATELDDDDVAGKSTNMVENPWYLPTLTKNKESIPEGAKTQNAESATTSVVNTTTAGRDEHTTLSHDLSRDHNGLNVIVEAADLLERQSSASGSVAAGTPPPSVPNTLATTPSGTMGSPSAHKSTINKPSAIAHSPEGVKKKNMQTPVSYDLTRISNDSQPAATAHSPQGVKKEKNMLTPISYDLTRISSDTQPSAIAQSPEGVKMKKVVTSLPYHHTKDSNETHNTSLETTKKMPTAATHKPQKSNNEHFWDPTFYATTTPKPTTRTPTTPMFPRPPHPSTPSISTPRPSSYPYQKSTGSYDPRNDPMNPYALPPQPKGGEKKKNHAAAPENIRTTAVHHQTKTTTRANLNEAGYAQSQGSAWTPINTAATSQYQAAGLPRPHLGAGYASGVYATEQRSGAEYGALAAPTTPSTPTLTPHAYTTYPTFSRPNSQHPNFPAPAAAPRANFPRTSLPNPYANLPVLKANPPIRPHPHPRPNTATGVSNSGRVFDGREVGRDERGAAVVGLPRYVVQRRGGGGSEGVGMGRGMEVEMGVYGDEDEEMEMEFGEEENEEMGEDIYHPGPRR